MLQDFIAVIGKRVGRAPTEVTVKAVGAALWVCRAPQKQPAVPLGVQDVDNLFEKASAHTLVFKFGKQGQDNYFARLPVGETISNKATVCNTHDTGHRTRSQLLPPRFKGYAKLGQAPGRDCVFSRHAANFNAFANVSRTGVPVLKHCVQDADFFAELGQASLPGARSARPARYAPVVSGSLVFFSRLSGVVA